MAGAVGDHGHGLGGGVGGIVQDLHVQHGGQTAQTLGADAQGVDLLVEFQAQFLGAVGGSAGLQLLDVHGGHERFLGHDAWPSPACRRCRGPGCPGGHQPAPMVGTGLEHPVHNGVGGVEHGASWTLSSEPPPLAATSTSSSVTGDQLA
ncbi:MAG: hypothetical protein U5L11_08515 [Arhodomonas sp.]|nr:hypothetical protein [Arhodomonas sp.]